MPAELQSCRMSFPLRDSSSVSTGQLWHFASSCCALFTSAGLSLGLVGLSWCWLCWVWSLLHSGEEGTPSGGSQALKTAPLVLQEDLPVLTPLVWEQFLNLMNFGGGINILGVVTLQKMSLAFVWEQSLDRTLESNFSYGLLMIMTP